METVNVGKKLVDNLIEEYNQNIKETRLVEKASAENENNQKCSSCTLYIVVFNILYNQYWNCCLFCLLLSVLKKRDSMCCA